MNNLDRSISDNLRISRSAYAWGWMQNQHAIDAVLMSELAGKPGDAQSRAFPHSQDSALSDHKFPAAGDLDGTFEIVTPKLTLVSA